MPESLYRKKSGIKIAGEPAADVGKPADTKKSGRAAATQKKSPAKKAAKKK